MQYTIRNVPRAVDAALRRRARATSRSLNAVTVEALAAGAGLDGARPPRRSLVGVAGSGALEPEVLKALSEQRRIERKIWR